MAVTASLCEIIVLVGYIQNGRCGLFDSLIGHKLRENVNEALRFVWSR